MSYTPTDWKTGDVITAEKLNNMESGIAEAEEYFVIHATGLSDAVTAHGDPSIDKTVEQIVAAYNAGKILVVTSNISVTAEDPQRILH